MSKKKLLIPVLLLVAVAAAIVGYIVINNNNNPDKVDLDKAVESVEAGDDGSTADAEAGAESTAADGGEVEGTAGEGTGIEGTWTVDTDSGDFDFQSATGTFVGFRVNEELVGIGATEAVGRTGDVSGEITITGNQMTAATFEADLSTITTDQSRRDDKVQSALETDQFPTATFTLTAPVDLPADASAGGEISVTATGDLTVHGVTKSVQIPLQAKLVSGTVVVVGSLEELDFTGFGITMPTAPVVASVNPVGTIEMQILLTKGA